MTNKMATVFVDSAEAAAQGNSLGQQLATALDNKSQTFQLVNNNAESVATVTGAFALFNPVNIQTQTFAAATTFLKIVADVQNGKSISSGDVLSLVGNISGAIATIAVYGELPEVEVTMVLIGKSAAIAGFIGDEEQALVNFASSLIQDNFSSEPVSNDPSALYLTSSNQIMTQEQMQQTGASYGVLVVTPDSDQATLEAGSSAGTLSGDEAVGAGDSGGGSDGGWDSGNGDFSDGDMGGEIYDGDGGSMASSIA